MGLEYVGESQTYACRRIYYTDENGNLVERILHDSEDIDPVIENNKELAASFRPHQKGNLRKVASVPPVTMLGWLHEANIPEWGGNEAMDYVFNKKLRDPENKYMLTVPDNYRMMRYG